MKKFVHPVRLNNPFSVDLIGLSAYFLLSRSYSLKRRSTSRRVERKKESILIVL
jgi:hypothetical protein